MATDAAPNPPPEPSDVHHLQNGESLNEAEASAKVVIEDRSLAPSTGCWDGHISSPDLGSSAGPDNRVDAQLVAVVDVREGTGGTAGTLDSTRMRYRVQRRGDRSRRQPSSTGSNSRGPVSGHDPRRPHQHDAVVDVREGTGGTAGTLDGTRMRYRVQRRGDKSRGQPSSTGSSSRGPVSGHDPRRPHQVGLAHDPALGHCTQAGAVQQASALNLD
ncbi:hypothetical protein HPB52_007195 [Rhipicephalus sanguineus]|uniref:Uncharacterized protein n=1 Tax=Rhipicephalus sanguineus TaxID=34632 RepID=A0A9D4T8X9_RHISA|nr:hypothetical protein HPB52_007195 [Rhipicephalus sanguineus]